MGCAIKPDGSIWCWEDHSKSNQVNGPELSVFASTPSPAGNPTFAVELAPTAYGLCYLDDAQTILCRPTQAAASFTTVQVRAGAKYQHVYGGRDSTICGLGVDGIVDCIFNVDDPVNTTITQTLTGIWTTFSVGLSHECGIRPDGSVECLGEDHFAGNFSNVLQGTVSTNDPIPIAGLTSPTTAIASGEEFSCALSSDATVQCWGADALGELGAGTIEINSAAPLNVLSHVVGLDVMGWRACAMTSDRHTWCWSKVYCPAADASVEVMQASAPTDLTSFFSAPVAAIAPDSFLICAVLLGGGVECFQLPDMDDNCPKTLNVYPIVGL
jgi:hypothetical protein